MKITFHHPPTGTANPLIDFEPWNQNHYPPEGEVGVYICGIRAKVDGVLKFIPMVVGEGNLRDALYKRHYAGKYLTAFENLRGCKKKAISEKKEIWDFSKVRYSVPDLKNIYSDMYIYDGLPRLGRKHPTFFKAIIALNNLLYFQNVDFFNHKYGLTEIPRNVRADEAVLILAEKSAKATLPKLKCRMQKNYMNLILTLSNFTENFYFIYAVDSSLSTRPNRLAAEVATKSALKSVGIHTTADSNRKGNINLIEKIDFSEIQNELVNIGGHNYSDIVGNYKDLIIPIRNKNNDYSQVSYQVIASNDLLDSLIREFQERKWRFEKKPYIEYSEKEAELELPKDLKGNQEGKPNFTIELLGCYKPNTNWSEVGQVILYMPKIREATIHYIKHLRKDNEYEPNNEEFEKYVKLLKTLVLIHEFTHSIVQAGVFRLKNNTDFSSPLELKYDDKDSIFFHETIAQIFTNYFCCKYAELKEMFFWLEGLQPIQYRIYKEEFLLSGQKANESDIERVIFILMISVDFYNHNNYERQKYKNLLDIYTLFNSTCVKDYFSDPHGFINKYMGKLTGKKFGI